MFKIPPSGTGRGVGKYQESKSNDLKTEQFVPSTGPDGLHQAVSVRPTGDITPTSAGTEVQIGFQPEEATGTSSPSASTTAAPEAADADQPADGSTDRTNRKEISDTDSRPKIVLPSKTSRSPR